MPTPQQIAEKYNREWIEAKPDMKTNYASVASEIVDDILAAKPRMIAAYTAAINGGALERGLSKYRGNDRLSVLYSEALDAISTIEPAKLEKIEDDVTLKRYLGSVAGDVLNILKSNTSSGTRGDIPNVSDSAQTQLINSAIIKNQDYFTTTTTPSAILSQIDSDLGTIGFPQN